MRITDLKKKFYSLIFVEKNRELCDMVGSNYKRPKSFFFAIQGVTEIHTYIHTHTHIALSLIFCLNVSIMCI